MKEKIISLRFKIYYNSLFKIKVWIIRKIVRILKLARPTSYPFITGDGFRALAQHIFDESDTVNTEMVKRGDIIFVRSDMVISFFKKIHPKIKEAYILISHNADKNIDLSYEKYIDNKIIHWFAQNLLIKHPRCTPIPIGLILRFYDKKNITIELLKKYSNKISKAQKIFFGFDIRSNKKRLQASNNLKKSQTGIEANEYLGKEEYYSQVANYMFNASPEGGGIDCHRTWESIYLNTIPIVERSIATEHWEKIGLPVLLIDSWSDVNSMTREYLDQSYQNLKQKLDSPAIYMNYWIEEIIKYKN